MKTQAINRGPKYLHLKQTLRERITRGEFAADGLLPTEKGLVREFGISRHTVIRAMSDLRTEGLITRTRGRGTFVNQTASQHGRIGVLTYLDRTQPIISAHAQNVLRAKLNRLCELGESPHLYSTFGMDRKGDIHQHGQDVLHHAARGQLRSLIVEGSYDAHQVEAALSRWGVHVIGSHVEEAISTYNVGRDDTAATKDGIQSLLDRGFRKLAIMVGKPTFAPQQKHVQVYLHLMEKNRLAIRPGWVCSEKPASAQTGSEEFARLWQMDDRPDAILIMDDIMAQGAARAMVDLHVDVPRELTVVVLMNRWSGLVLPVPVTALEIDPEPIGIAAAEMAFRLVRGEFIPEPHLWIKPRTRIYEVTEFSDSTTVGRESETQGKGDSVPHANTTKAAEPSASR